MNEIHFLRTQLAAEQRHLEAVLAACTGAIASSPTKDFLQICADYLIPSVKAWAARDRARLSLHYARNARADQGKSAEALKLEALMEAASEHWAALPNAADLVPALHRATQSLGQWLRAREAAQALLDDSAYSVDQWRKVAFVDARSILEERNRYRRVEAALPLGVEEMGRHGH